MRRRKSNRNGWWARYRAYLKSPEWQAKRQRLYRDRKGRCEDCGKALGKAFHAHHENYARMGDEDLEDLKLLCHTCHQKRHPKKKLRPRKRKRSAYTFAVLAILALTLIVLFLSSL